MFGDTFVCDFTVKDKVFELETEVSAGSEAALAESVPQQWGRVRDQVFLRSALYLNL